MHHDRAVDKCDREANPGQQKGRAPFAKNENPNAGLSHPEHDERDEHGAADAGDLHKRREGDLCVAEMPVKQPDRHQFGHHDRGR